MHSKLTESFPIFIRLKNKKRLETRFSRSTVTGERISVGKGEFTPYRNTQFIQCLQYSFVDILLGFGHFLYLKIDTFPSLALPGLMGD